MNALFLAGGMGTRLRPLTERVPKPMMPVMGKPLLERSMNQLKQHGVNNIVLSVCYRPEYIEGHFGDGGGHGLCIRYVRETTPLGTGGAIRYSRPYLDDTFLVFNADIMCDIDYTDMLQFHRRHNADITIAVTEVEDPTAYGVVERDHNNYVTRFTEKPQPHEVRSNLINAGIYIFNRSVLGGIPTDRPVSVEREVFPNLLRQGGKIAVYNGCSYWLDIGTPEKYLQAQWDVFNGRYPVEETDFNRERYFLLPGSELHEPVVMRGPVYIGEHVEIGPGAQIGPNVVIGSGSVIGAGSKLSGSVLWDNCRVPPATVLSDSVLTDDCCVQDIQHSCRQPLQTLHGSLY